MRNSALGYFGGYVYIKNGVFQDTRKVVSSDCTVNLRTSEFRLVTKLNCETCVLCK